MGIRDCLKKVGNTEDDDHWVPISNFPSSHDAVSFNHVVRCHPGVKTADIYRHLILNLHPRLQIWGGGTF